MPRHDLAACGICPYGTVGVHINKCPQRNERINEELQVVREERDKLCDQLRDSQYNYLTLINELRKLQARFGKILEIAEQ